jgi:uncharacterized protein YjbK
MSNAIEIEAKALVEKKDYEKIVALFKDYPAYSQTNYYIDNDAVSYGKKGSRSGSGKKADSTK